MMRMQLAGKEVRIFEAQSKGAPLVLLNSVHGEGKQVCRAVKELTDVDFSLAAVANIDWDNEMSPWAVSPVMKDGRAFTGGADGYLQKLTEIILPEILTALGAKPEYIALSGYSLAGLFAVYAMYQTNVFERIASASGSFWYPDFLEYVQKHEPKRKPERLYFSLGDKEKKARNAMLKTVEERTKWLSEWYAQQDIQTVFELNPGNHFQEDVERMAKGICWILQK